MPWPGRPIAEMARQKFTRPRPRSLLAVGLLGTHKAPSGRCRDRSLPIIDVAMVGAARVLCSEIR